MPKVYIEDKNAFVDFPDDIDDSEIQRSIKNTFYSEAEEPVQQESGFFNKEFGPLAGFKGLAKSIASTPGEFGSTAGALSESELGYDIRGLEPKLPDIFTGGQGAKDFARTTISKKDFEKKQIQSNIDAFKTELGRDPSDEEMEKLSSGASQYRSFLEKVQEKGFSLYDKNQEFLAKTFSPEQSVLGKLQEAIGSGAGSIAKAALVQSMIPIPFSGGTALGVGEAAAGFAQTRQAGISDTETRANVFGTKAIALSALEAWGLEGIVQGAKGGIGAFKNAMVSEGMTEFLQSEAGAIIDQQFGITDKGLLTTIVEQFPEAAFEGVIGALLGGGGSVAGNLMLEKEISNATKKISKDLQKAGLDKEGADLTAKNIVDSVMNKTSEGLSDITIEQTQNAIDNEIYSSVPVQPDNSLDTLVEEAKKYKTLEDFSLNVGIDISQENVEALGYNNYDIMMEKVFKWAKYDQELNEDVTPEAQGEITAEQIQKVIEVENKVFEETNDSTIMLGRLINSLDAEPQRDVSTNRVREILANSQISPSSAYLARVNEYINGKDRINLDELKTQISDALPSIEDRIDVVQNTSTSASSDSSGRGITYLSNVSDQNKAESVRLGIAKALFDGSRRFSWDDNLDLDDVVLKELEKYSPKIELTITEDAAEKTLKSVLLDDLKSDLKLDSIPQPIEEDDIVAEPNAEYTKVAGKQDTGELKQPTPKYDDSQITFEQLAGVDTESINTEAEVARNNEPTPDIDGEIILDVNSGKSTPLMEAPFSTKFKETNSLSFPDKKVSGPADIAFAFQSLKNSAFEKAFLVGVKDGNVTGVQLLGIGDYDRATVNVGQIFNMLQVTESNGYYLVHNHPSGTIEPSTQDIALTNKIKPMLELLNMEQLGHVIINDTKFGFIDPDGEISQVSHEEYSNTKSVSVLEKYQEWNKNKDSLSFVRHSKDVYEITKGLVIGGKDAIAVFMNRANGIINIMNVGENVTPGHILDLATRSNASSVILAGNITTEKVNEISNNEHVSFGRVQILDGVIFEDGKYTSMSDLGTLRENGGEYATTPLETKESEFNDSAAEDDYYLANSNGRKFSTEDAERAQRMMDAIENSTRISEDQKEVFVEQIISHMNGERVFTREDSEAIRDTLESEVEHLKQFMKNEQENLDYAIRKNGGIRRFASGAMQGEYDLIPSRYKRSNSPFDPEQMFLRLQEIGFYGENMSSFESFYDLLNDVHGRQYWKSIPEDISNLKQNINAINIYLKQDLKGVATNTQIKKSIQESVLKGKKTVIVFKADMAIELRKQLRHDAKIARDAARAEAQRQKDLFSKDLKSKTENLEVTKKHIIEFAKTELTLHDRGKFLDTVKNAETYRDVEKAISRIDKYATQNEYRQIKSQILKQLKTIDPKIASGKPIGKFDAYTQEILDIIKSAAKLNKTDAQSSLTKILESLGEDFPSDTQKLEIMALSMAGGLEANELNIAQLNELLDEIINLKTNARASKFLEDEFRKQIIDAYIEKSVSVISGGKGLDPLAVQRGIQDAKDFKTWLTTLGKSMFGWDDINDILSFKDKKSKGYEGWLVKFGNVNGELRKEKQGILDARQKLQDMAMDAYGISNEKDLVKKIHDDIAEEVDLGLVTFADGQRGHLVFNRAELRKRWMELQDKSLEHVFLSDQGMAYTPVIIGAIYLNMTSQDKAFATMQLNFYRDYYRSTNAVYSALYGLNLPFNEMYSPIRREGFVISETPSGMFMEDVKARASSAPGAVKSRTENLRGIKKIADVSILQQHISEMEHFKAFAYKVKDMRAVYNSSLVQQAVRENFGNDMNKQISSFLDDITSGGTIRANRVMALDKFRHNFTKSVLGGKPSITIKQLVSFVAYAETIPVDAFAGGVIDFLANPKEAMDILDKSSLMGTRGENIDRDLKDIAQSDEAALFRENKSFTSFTDLLTKNVKIGDRGAIYLGGWSIYKYWLEKTKDPEIAMQKFEEVTTRTQQSGDISEQSYWQRSGSFAKIMTMFASSPNQYLRREVAALRNMAAGRISSKQFLKTMFIYHILLPNLFQMIMDVLRPWDEEGLKTRAKNHLRASTWGSFNGMFVIKDGLAYLSSMAIEGKARQPQGNPLFSIFSDGGKVVKLAHKGFNPEKDVSLDDVTTAIRGLLSASGKLVGAPLDYGYNIADGFMDLAFGDARKWIGKMLGYTPYSLGEYKSSKKTNNRRRRK